MNTQFKMATVRTALREKAASVATPIEVLDDDEMPIEPRSISVQWKDRRLDMGIEVARIGHATEGSGKIVRQASMADVAEVAMREMLRIDALERRAAALSDNHYDPKSPPSWSLCADVASATVLDGVVASVREALNPPGAVWDRRENGHVLRMEDGERITDMVLIRRGSHCGLKVTVHANPERRIVHGTYWYDDATMIHPTLCMAMRDVMPQTLMMAAVGRPLCEVVMLPGKQCSSVVRAMDSVQNQENGLHYISISLERRTKTLCAPPQGVATDWMSAAGPRTTPDIELKDPT